MEKLKEIIAKRSAPGVLIFDLEDRLLYSNQEALEMLRVLRGDEGEESIPGEIYQLCGELRGGSQRAGAVSDVIRHSGESGEETELHYGIRALLLGGHGEGKGSSHVMVLIEKIITKRRLDVETARERFQLSKRETEVVRLICQGLSNREISGVIFISEFTVKDHLKNIMRKMGTGSRNEIIAALL